MAMESLLARFAAVLSKLDHLERAAGVTSEDVLAYRQQAVLDRVAALERAAGLAAGAPAAAPPQHGEAPPAAAPTAAAVVSPAASAPAAVLADPGAHPSLANPAASETQKRLARELIERGITAHRFVRCPPEYYDRPLEFRQQCLQAASIDHLCKTIIMENTRAHPDIKDWSNPANSKYYLVLVQYSARLNAEKLKSFIHKMNIGKYAKKYFNMRLAPEAVSDELSGFTHNAVSPIAIKTRLPIIMSHKIAELQPDFFFLGAGEVDLKVGLSAREFIEAYKPFVVDCTYEEGENGGGEDAAAGGAD